MWCVIGIPVALVVGYFLAAMMFNASHADDTSYDAMDWTPYDKPTVIRLRQKETDDESH